MAGISRRSTRFPAAGGATLVLTSLVMAACTVAASGQAGVAAGDRRFDAVEEIRGNRPVVATTVDRRYDALEDTRANRGVVATNVDRRYDAIEAIRASR